MPAKREPDEKGNLTPSEKYGPLAVSRPMLKTDHYLSLTYWSDSPDGCSRKHLPYGRSGTRQNKILFLLQRHMYTEDGRISSQP